MFPPLLYNFRVHVCWEIRPGVFGTLEFSTQLLLTMGMPVQLLLLVDHSGLGRPIVHSTAIRDNLNLVLQACFLKMGL
eukprot:scaffold1720_cov353-Pavlova_lutheri.AAC.12